MGVGLRARRGRARAGTGLRAGAVAATLAGCLLFSVPALACPGMAAQGQTAAGTQGQAQATTGLLYSGGTAATTAMAATTDAAAPAQRAAAAQAAPAVRAASPGLLRRFTAALNRIGASVVAGLQSVATGVSRSLRTMALLRPMV